MSHFTVLVVGKDPESQLIPYNEDTNGLNPKYVEFEDIEKKYLKSYKTESVEKVKMPDGRLLNTWDEEFRVPGTFGTGGGSHKVPDHLKTVKVKFTKLYPTFEDYMKDWCGYKERDPKKKRFGYWTNPNAKWDWYTLGGRWTGFFKLKNQNNLGNNFTTEEAAKLALQYDVSTATVQELANILKNYDQAKMDAFNKAHPISGGYRLEKAVQDLLTTKYAHAKVGKPGIMTALAENGHVDQALKKDIDFDAMREAARIKATERYDRMERLMGGKIEPLATSWEDLQDKPKYAKLDWDERRTLYWAQPQLKKLEEVRRTTTDTKDKEFLGWIEYSTYTVGREVFIKDAIDNAISTFAVVKDGKWFERGNMGWWGCVSNEKDPKKWNREFSRLLDKLPEDTLLSVYDCHI